jgi:hypothetical protein
LRNHPLRFLLAFLLLLLPLPAQAALTPEGPPLVIAEAPFCPSDTEMEVIATPKGAFEVVWADETTSEVRGLRFGRNLQPTGAPQVLLPLLDVGFFSPRFAGTWAGRYELAMTVLDFGNNPGNPLTGYRLSLDLEGDPLAPPARVKPARFVDLVPAAGGDSLQFRFEPPFFGTPNCQSEGLLARRIDPHGAPLSAESRVNRRASAWTGRHLAIDRAPNDTFVAVYSTCEKFVGLVARRLNAAGAPIGKPINFPLPDRIANIGDRSLVAAAHGTDFAVAAVVNDPNGGGDFIEVVIVGVANGQVFGPTPVAGIVVDLEASPSGGYLLLFRTFDSPHFTLFAQELNARGVPQGAPLAITGEEGRVDGAAASLPNGRWIVIAREQNGDPGDAEACSERVVGTVLTASP